MNTRLINGVINTLKYPRSIDRNDLYSEGCLVYLQLQDMSEAYLWNSIKNELIRYIHRETVKTTNKGLESIVEHKSLHLSDYFDGQQLQVLQLIAEGYQYTEISEQLQLSVRTIERIVGDIKHDS